MKTTNFAIDHAVAVYVLIAMIVLGGLVAYAGLPREAAPDITIPVVVVSTPYYGVAPADIETLVTQPIERELKDLKDVDQMTSSSSEGVSIVTVQFEPKVDLDEAVQKMREKVDKAKPDLPSDAEDPIITEINFSELPIMIVNLYGDADQVVLKEVGEDLQDKFEAINGVLSVNLSGGLEREIQVLANPAQLEHYGLSINDLIGTLQRENVNLPGGSVDMGPMSFLVRVDGEFKSPAMIGDLVVKDKQGQPIYVRDVAQVVDGFKEPTTYARFGGQTNVSLSIQKRAGENLVRITDDAKAILEAYKQERLPAGVQVAITADVSEQVRDQVSDLENNILTGLLLVLVVLLFFMGGMRNSFFVAAAIPLSMLVSFAVLSVMDITLNMVVLFSLVLALGMLVDNAIVIVENIYRHATMGKGRAQAAKDAVAEVGWPVITSTATTVAAFAPMLFWPGLIGEFMGFLPLTVIIVLLSSLFVALIINPVLCSTLLKVKPGVSLGDESVPDTFIYRWYKATLQWSIRHRWVVVAAALVSFVGTFVVFGMFNVGVEFFPETTPNRAFVRVKAPDGTRLAGTDGLVRPLESAVMPLENVKSVVTEVGVGGSANDPVGGGGASANSARLTVDFLDEENRIEAPKVTLDRIRQAQVQIAGAEFEIEKESSGPPAGKPVNLEIIGDDFHELGRIARDVRDLIRDTPGMVDLKDNYVSGRPEVQVDVNRRQAALVGVSTSAIANTVRAAVNGVTATKFRDGEDEYDIVVRLDKPYRRTLEDIEGLTISARDGAQVPLRELAKLRMSGGTGSIRHLDRERVVTVEANVLEGYLPNDVLKEVQKRLKDYKLPEGYKIKYTGENEEQAEAAAFLAKALMIALFLIALVLVTQFNSVLQPLVIVASVFLSLIGVLWGLVLTRTPFGIIMVGIGIISLAGVVVNNSIVLIDYTNQLRDQGMPVRKAVVQAGLVRFRPVMLTAVTTILGLMPMVVGVSVDFFNLKLIVGSQSVEMWGPMARSVSSGLLVATVLTLVFVPVMYTFADDVGRFFDRLTQNGVSGGSNGKPGVQKGRIAAGVVAMLAAGAALVVWAGWMPAAQAQELDPAATPEAEKIVGTQGEKPGEDQVNPETAKRVDPTRGVIPEVKIASSRTMTLAQVREQVAEESFDVKLVGERLKRADTLLDKAWSLLLPTVSAQAVYTIYDQEQVAAFGPQEIVIQPRTLFVATGKVQVSLFNGRAWPLLQNAYASQELEKLGEEQLKMELERAVTQVYYQLLTLKRVERIGQASLASRLLILKAAEERLEVGAGTAFDVTRAKVEVIKARKEIESTRLSWIKAREALAGLLNTPADFDVVGVDGPANVPSEETLVEEAIRQRPDLALRRKQAEVADRSVDVELWRYAPNLSAAWNITRQETTPFQPNAFVWNIQLVAAWTLYDGGLREAEIAESRSELVSAQIELDKLEHNLRSDIRQAYQDAEQYKLQLLSTRQEVTLAREAFDQASDGYKLGAVTQLDVFSSELNLRLAQASLAQQELAYALAVETLLGLVNRPSKVELGGR